MCRSKKRVEKRNIRTPDWYRLQILTIVSQNPSSLTKISNILSISKPLACYYMKQLYEAGLISIVRYSKGRRGPRRKCYGITAKGVAILRSWRVDGYSSKEVAHSHLKSKMAKVLQFFKRLF